MSIKNKLKSIICPDVWCCAIRFNDDSNVNILNNITDVFTVIKDNYRFWTADPFLVFENDKYYLFFEVFDRLKRKGLLGYREVSEDNVGDIKVIYESDSHLSFPFIYKENGTYYIIPESNKQSELFRLRCISFPDKWEKDEVLLKDNLVDTVRFENGAEIFYISERVIENNVFDRVDLFFEEDGEIKECAANPVKADAQNARGAGAVFECNGKLIRPSQDCGKAYGEKLNFNEIVKICRDEYNEKPIKTISHRDLKLNVKNDFIGIHTYNRTNTAEVVDLKIKGTFNPLNTLGAVIKQIKRAIKFLKMSDNL